MCFIFPRESDLVFDFQPLSTSIWAFGSEICDAKALQLYQLWEETPLPFPLPSHIFQSGPTLLHFSSHAHIYSCEGPCCLNQLFIHLKAAVRRFIVFSDICDVQMLASLRGNQWFLLRITPTQTLASCAIIILLRSFASRRRWRQHTEGEN